MPALREPNTAQTRGLSDLLVGAFDPDGFLALLRGLPDGLRVVRELPGRESPPQYYFASAIDAVLRHGLVDATFFAALRSARPHRVAEIDGLARSFGFELPAPPHPTLAPAGHATPRPPEVMRPTLAAWIHGHALALLAPPLALALAVAVAALASAGPSLRGVLVAALAGQASFSLAVWWFLAGWHAPGCTRLGRCASYTALTRRLARDPRDRRSAALAREASRQFAAAWSGLWLAWTALYLLLTLYYWAHWQSDAPLPECTPSTPGIASYLHRVLCVTLNNVTAGSTLVCHATLSLLTVGSPAELAQRERAVDLRVLWSRAAVLIACFAAVHGLVVLAPFAAQTLAPGAAIRAAALHEWFRLASGMTAAIVTALFVGRLSSKYLDVPPAILGALYGYAALQLGWPLIEHGAARPSALAWNLALFAGAWLSKLALLTVLAWLYHTGRLDFYFLRVRSLHLRVVGDWHALTRGP